jgi:CheY-like chemotaxis protein
LAPEPVDPNKLVGGMAELLHRSLGENVRLETVLGAGIWRTHADASQLESALLNLAVNARDAMPEGGKLTIETNNAFLDDEYAAHQIGVPAGQYVLIAVTDTGVGMSRDIVEHAFDPFFTTNPRQRHRPWPEPGVWFHPAIRRAHQFYSELGQGTTVKIYLPRHYDDGVAARVAPLTVAPARGAAHETILVVEDDERVRRLAADTLAELGYRVLQADGAAAALRQLSELPPVDLLFTDIIITDTNGRTLADEARKQQPGLKVLFTTVTRKTPSCMAGSSILAWI